MAQLTRALDRMLASARASKRAPLTAEEIDYVIVLLTSWLDLLARGVTPGEVAHVARLEATRQAIH